MAGPSATATFQHADGHDYMLGRNHIAACRLNVQHFLWREVFGFSIHPSIPLRTERTSLQIADVAAGTGLWLIDVARERPTARLHGLDIDLTQAPHHKWLPANVEPMRPWDLFSELPRDLVGRFDLVHVRLLVMVLSGSDENTAKAIHHLLQLVKPGGYLQWDELDCVGMRIRKVEPTIPAPALEEIRTASSSNGRHDWVRDLPHLLEQGGFQDTNLQLYDEPPQLIRAFNDHHLLIMDEFASRLLEIGKHEAAARFRQLIRDGYQECVNGAALSIPRLIVTAKRPEPIPQWGDSLPSTESSSHCNHAIAVK